MRGSSVARMFCLVCGTANDRRGSGGCANAHRCTRTLVLRHAGASAILVWEASVREACRWESRVRVPLVRAPLCGASVLITGIHTGVFLYTGEKNTLLGCLSPGAPGAPALTPGGEYLGS